MSKLKYVKLCISCNKEFASMNHIACYDCYLTVPDYIPAGQINRYLKEKYEKEKFDKYRQQKK